MTVSSLQIFYGVFRQSCAILCDVRAPFSKENNERSNTILYCESQNRSLVRHPIQTEEFGAGQSCNLVVQVFIMSM